MTTIKNRKEGNRIEYHYWGYSFEWNEFHQTSDELRPFVDTYDRLADECVGLLDEYPRKETGGPSKRDLYEELREHADEDPKLKELWTQVNTVPEWVDWDQIQRGQDVFFRYALPIMNVLTFESLLGGMAGPRVVETLSRTGGFNASVVRRRLLETVQHTLQVNRSVQGMKPGGEGHVSSVRVRLLHSSVRRRILDLAEQKPEYYDKQKHGIPINDLDSIATINTFSTTVVWMGLPRQGVYLSKQEVEDYVALWRLVAYYMGTPTEPFETTTKARAMMESLLVSELAPTEMGRILAKNIILGLENTAPAYATKEFMEAMTRMLIGDQMSDELDIPPPDLYHRALIFGYLVWVSTLSYIVPKIWFLDRSVIAIRRKTLYKLITDEKIGLGGETIFNFKYIPTFERTTRLGWRRSSKFERPGVQVLAYLGLLAVFMGIATLGTGIYFTAIGLPRVQGLV